MEGTKKPMKRSEGPQNENRKKKIKTSLEGEPENPVTPETGPLQRLKPKPRNQKISGSGV